MTTLEQVKIRLKQFHMEKTDGKDVVVFDKIEDNPLIEQLIEQAKKDVIVTDIKAIEGKNPYTYCGDIIIIPGCVMILMIIFKLLKRKYIKNQA